MNDKRHQSGRHQSQSGGHPTSGGRSRRTTTGLRAATDLSATVKERLAGDGRWGHFSQGGAWICPYCLSAVRGHDETRAALVRAIEGHLGRRCTAYREGNGSPQPAEIIAAKRSHEDIAYFALTNPAWQVFDHEGFWYSPCSLTRVQTVRIANGRFDSFTIQNMVAHLNECRQYLGGVVHPVEAVQRARDQALRAVNLTTNLRQLIQFPLWRYADPTGHWVCPFCLGHIDHVRLTSADDWAAAPEQMAAHLAFACAAYVPERPEPKSEAQVQQAAGGEVTAAPGTRRTSANVLPLPTGGRDPSGRVVTPVTGGTRLAPRVGGTSGANPIAPRVGGTSGANPVAPRGGSGAAPIAPVARPVSGSSQIVPTSPTVPTPAVTGARGTGVHGTSGAHGTSGGHGISGSSRIAMPVVPPAARVDPPSEAEAPEGDAPALDWMDVVESTQEGTPTQGHDTERMRARDVQKGMLTDAPVIEGFSFATRFEACHDISGDFYEFISLPDGRIGFAQGDVSGHGMHAGLIMSMAKKTLAIFAEAGNSPTDTLSKVNDSLASDLGGKIFISMVYAILDPHDRTITWGRAGHNPIIRFNINTGTLTEIKPKGMVVGMKAGQLFRRASENEVTQVDSGDVFLIYTDGITETMNRQQVEYGTDLLNEVIRKHAAAGPELLLDRIMESVRQFRGGTSVEDDLTLLVLAVE